jgi:hypothetical protein
MGILRHRRFRRQEAVPNDDEYEEDYGDEEGDEGDDSSATTIPSGLPTTTTENQFDKAKAIGKDVIEKVPSKYFFFFFVRRNYSILMNQLLFSYLYS